LTPDFAYWAGHCSAFDDATLLRFLAAVEARRNRYDAALAAAQAEALRRNLIKEKAALTGGQSTIGRKHP
jgi:hypothetical protein